MSVRVLICDDQPLVRAGVRTLLSTQPDIEIVGDATDGAAAIAAVDRLRPNVVLMDIRMPGTDGITATQRITAGERAPRVLVLTTYDQDEYVFNALAAGASGFLLKDARPEDLISGIRSVAAGDALLAPSVTRRLIGLFAHDRPAQSRRAGDPVGLLTNREREVLRLVARGLSNSDIAATLHITEHTVKTHVANLLNKLDLRDRVHAVIFAYEHRVIDRGLDQL
ncbi:MAG TPA: response regulator transcription factor [Pseudonocardiaceae bacterium]|nr:response regulator transcription factor [Pseudonocardiaceae bacterium]